ncbi:MAG: VOC family protein [Alphaproteobacteria bacterium]|nr:VOC family protein [Alphaproteobacteria bacterium]
MTAKLRHIALSVPDPQKAAAFYETALGMTRVGENDHAGATAVYLTDGVMNVALLRYKTDEAAAGDPDDFGIHHFGFVVDDVDAARAEIEAAGGTWLMGEAKGAGAFYEIKFRDPDGQVFDINEGGWRTGDD